MTRDPGNASSRRSDPARARWARKLGAIIRDPAVWAWAAVALLALLPLREALARL